MLSALDENHNSYKGRSIYCPAMSFHIKMDMLFAFGWKSLCSLNMGKNGIPKIWDAV